MEKFTNIIKYFQSFTTEMIIEIIIAIGIIVFFYIISPIIAKMLTKILKKNIKKKELKTNKLYLSLRFYIKVIGIYLSILFIKNILQIDEKIFVIINKLFRITTIFIIARIVAETITLENINKLNKNGENTVTTNFALKIIKAVIYACALFIAILDLGYDLSGLITGLGIGSVVITLAAQNIAKDLLGGVVIFTDKPFQVGDWIQFDLYEGTVEDITYRSTRIRTFENSIVNIPNSIISNASIINCSKIEKRRYKINLEIELNTPLSKIKSVEEKVKTMLKEKENVMEDSVIVKFDKITVNGMNLLIYAFTDSVDYENFLREKEEINFKIMQILESENVELAYDTKTVFLKNVSP